MAVRNLYEILNVSRDAEPVVIEAAYRALMKKYHPDQGMPTAADAPSASDINRAFSILRDPDRRTQYDHYEWARQQQMHLAQYQPPAPPAPPRVFGWGGWAVALLLAGVILLMARDREDLASVEVAASDLATPAQAAGHAGTDAKRMPSFLRSNAPEREVDLLRRAGTSASTVAAVDAEPRAQAPARASRRQKSHPPRRRPAETVARHDRDFLEREGYIY
jgi:curved DNA-binding protein CbpA